MPYPLGESYHFLQADHRRVACSACDQVKQNLKDDTQYGTHIVEYTLCQKILHVFYLDFAKTDQQKGMANNVGGQNK